MPISLYLKTGQFSDLFRKAVKNICVLYHSHFFAEFGDEPLARGEILLFESIDWKCSPAKGINETSKCGKYFL